MILSCHNIKKSFVGDDVLRGGSFILEEHEKAAIVGINGAGKSTLLKIIVGEMSADDGIVTIAKDTSVGYLAQQNMIESGRTIYEEVRSAKAHIIQMEQNMRRMESDMKHQSGEALTVLMDQYHRLVSAFELENGYALESEIAGVLKGLGFTEDEFSRKTDELSGGQKTRVALAKLLLSSPDLIMLDEPTNHLDIGSIAWLENYLRTYKGAVLIVSHDRYFLNRVVSKVIEIDRGYINSFSGDYNAYSVKKEQLRESQMRAWLKQQDEIKHQEEVIAKLRSFNREKSIKRAESREKMLSKIDVLEKPTEENSEIRLELVPVVESGNDVLTVSGLSKSFGQAQLFSDLDFQIRKGEHVALIGDNGTGKTTILKIINGLLDADKGKVELGAKVEVGYYDQEHQVLHAEKTLFEELSDTYPDMNNTQIRNVLAAFLFTGDDVFKRVSELSGGERGRVSLAKLMLSNANFLILDEPTNHLDLVSKEILESAINRYKGTVLYVSHDRYFINQTCSRIIELTGRTLVNYLGNYDYYLEKSDALRAIYAPSSGAGNSSSISGSAALSSSGSAAEAKPLDSKAEWARAKEQQAIERKRKADLKKTEDRIAVLEEEDRQIDEELTKEEVFTNLAEVTKHSARKAEIAAELEELYEAWEELAQD